MGSLTVKDLYNIHSHEDDVSTFYRREIDGVPNDISYFPYGRGKRIGMLVIHAKTNQERLDCLRIFCERMFGGGTLLIDINIPETHFDDYDLIQNGFYTSDNILEK